jgi:hypothetical protein
MSQLAHTGRGAKSSRYNLRRLCEELEALHRACRIIVLGIAPLLYVLLIGAGIIHFRVEHLAIGIVLAVYQKVADLINL